MNGMGCTGEAGQTSKARQFLRLHHIVNIQLYMHFGVQFLFLFCFLALLIGRN